MHSRLQRAWFVGLGLLVTSWLPAVVHACPMCFNGKDSNSDAFLYGSLLLMFVPVTALGGLAYWAYKRIHTQAPEGPADSPPGASDGQADPQLDASQRAVVLQLADRR
jgi:uncharacterized membrane protein YebE (DUF533 family)